MANMVATERSNIVAIADEIRTISGINEEMTLGTMGEKMDIINAEVEAQADLISQIASVLESKSGGSGSSGNDSITITISGSINNRAMGYIDADTKAAINSITTGKLIGSSIKPLGGAICVYGGEIVSASCEYISCFARNDYFMYVFLSSGTVSFN